jgi:hypothetical protein
MSRTDDVNWRLTTFDGAELEQLRSFRSLSLMRKLSIVEEMADRARFLMEQRRRRGLPYFDLGTDQLIPGVKRRT